MRIVVGLATVGAGALVALGVACSSSSSVPPPPANESTQCSTDAGQFPVANCVPYDPASQSCTSPALSCNTAPCDSTSPCLAMGADNTGQAVANFRMRKLNITAPDALAFQPPSHVFVQKAVIDQGIYLHNFCGENRDGTFSWLIQVDTKNNTVKTGGAPPTDDPFGKGYCFVDATLSGLNVAPVTVNLTKASDGTYTSDKIPKLYVPIYSPAASGGYQTIILPLTDAQVKDVALSESNNCIGSYNADAITSLQGSACLDDPTSCSRWTTAGSLGGFITLYEANGVAVPQLSETLCMLLSPTAPVDTSDPNLKKCAVDSAGHVQATGDYCSTTQSPGGCKDSDWLAATFAASAAKIVDPNQPDCMGSATTGDGGTGDGGSPVDAGGQ